MPLLKNWIKGKIRMWNRFIQVSLCFFSLFVLNGSVGLLSVQAEMNHFRYEQETIMSWSWKGRRYTGNIKMNSECPWSSSSPLSSTNPQLNDRGITGENTAEDNNDGHRSGNHDSREMTAENVKFREMAEMIFKTPQLHLLEEEEFIFPYAHSRNKKKSGMRKVQMRH